MRLRLRLRSIGWLLVAGLLMAAAPAVAEGNPRGPKVTPPASSRAKVDEYVRARQAFDEETAIYWRSIAEKRRVRNSKRRNNEPIQLEDYVLTQPPVYLGPPRPIELASPGADPTETKKPDIPVVADFLKAAAE